jgi:hypothetical protein
MSQVINVKKAELKKQGFNSLEDWLNSSPNHIYIGRNMTHYVKGAIGSKWANPFKVDINGRDDACDKYESYVRTNHLLANSIHELDGKILGCWCHPEKCHGHILMKLVKEYKEKTNLI